jgi:uncharacterized protein YfaT (DUF1175 family)
VGGIRGPRIGEKFVTADNIQPGDLVYWDRGPDGELMLRRLDEWLLESHAGPVYRVDPGPSGPLSVMFTEVKAALQ